MRKISRKHDSSRDRLGRRLRLECLEHRQLLAVASNAYWESVVAPIAYDLDTVDFEKISYDSSVFDEGWFRFTPARSGIFSAQLESRTSGGSTSVNLYSPDAYQMLRRRATGEVRFDASVTAGNEYYLLVTNASDRDKLFLSNQVQFVGTEVTVYGTDDNDRFDFSSASGCKFKINRVDYQYSASDVSKLLFKGGLGNDSISIQDSPGNDVLQTWPSQAIFTGLGLQVRTESVEALDAYSYAGGTDIAYMHDSPGDDDFTGTTLRGKLRGSGHSNSVKFFDRVHVYADSGGFDIANVGGSASDDVFTGRPEMSIMKGDGFHYQIHAFDRVHSTAGEGTDRARLHGSQDNDNLVASPTGARLSGSGYELVATGYDSITANGEEGIMDEAELVGSAGDDIFIASSKQVILSGTGYNIHLEQFNSVNGDASQGGNDIARLYGSAEDDTFVGRPDWSTMSSPDWTTRAQFFDEVHAYAAFGYGEAGGLDTAKLYDSEGNDSFEGHNDYGQMQGPGYLNRAGFFDVVQGYSESGGHDEAVLFDSEGIDHLQTQNSSAEISRPSESTVSEAIAFDQVFANLSSHDDVVEMDPSNTVDLQVQWPADAQTVQAIDFLDTTSPTLGFQDAIDSLPAEGGVVILPVGNWILRAGLQLRSNVTLRGQEVASGIGCQLIRQEPVETVLTSPASQGDSSIEVTSTEGFRVGDEVGLYSYIANAKKIEHPTLTHIESNRLWFDRPISSDVVFHPDNRATVSHYYPLIRGTWDQDAPSIQNVTIENLALHGNVDSTNKRWRLVGPGLINLNSVSNAVIRNNLIFFSNSHGIVLADGKNNLITDTIVENNMGHAIVLTDESNTTVRNSTVRDSGSQTVLGKKYPSDGILAEGGLDIVVTNVLTEGNSRYGFHTAGNLTRDGVWSQNIIRNNGTNGFHFCYNNFAITLFENQIYGNGKDGIGGISDGGFYGDHFNVISNNVIHNNGRWGISVTNTSDNFIVGNSILDNSQIAPNTYSGIYLSNALRNHLSDNYIGSNSNQPTQLYGIHEHGKSDDNVILRNTGHGNLRSDFVVAGLHTQIIDSEGTVIGPEEA